MIRLGKDLFYYILKFAVRDRSGLLRRGGLFAQGRAIYSGTGYLPRDGLFTCSI